VLYQLSYTSSVLHPVVWRRPVRLRLVEHITQDALYPPSNVRSQCDADRRGDQDGATPQNRTGDTRIFSAVLYQLS
jgi:hypothetical protein